FCDLKRLNALGSNVSLKMTARGNECVLSPNCPNYTHLIAQNVVEISWVTQHCRYCIERFFWFQLLHERRRYLQGHLDALKCSCLQGHLSYKGYLLRHHIQMQGFGTCSNLMDSSHLLVNWWMGHCKNRLL